MSRIYLKRNGFTLIELLVVVGIIVILAALIIVNITQARMSGRDAKRIADVASLQLALEMYKDKNGKYPPEINGWAAAADSNITTTNCEGYGSMASVALYQCAWNNLSSDLSSYLSPLPKDPLNKPDGYRYYVDIENLNRTGAIIKTKLEANPEKMKEDSCQGIYNNPDYYDVISGNWPSAEETDGLNHCNGDGESGGDPTL